MASSKSLLVSLLVLQVVLALLAPSGLAQDVAPDVLKAGESIAFRGKHLVSSNKQYALNMGPDCELALFGPSGKEWTSDTSGSIDFGCNAKLESNGQLIIYSGGSVQIKAFGPERGAEGNYVLVLEDDGDCKIYPGQHWSLDEWGLDQ